jgi:ParB family transcriptional regulator, chromosome partitioning protein
MMSKTKKAKPGLGRGLEALLPSSMNITEKGIKFGSDEKEHINGQVALIEINKVEFNPYQPRKDFNPKSLEDLTNSILEHGVIQPITVRKSVTGYELISGERRLRASDNAGYTKIPAYVLEVKDDVQMLEIALIENLQREDLNPIEIANGYQRLIEECEYTQEQVAVKVSKDRSTVTNFLRLLRLPEKIQESLRKKEISMGHARALLGLSSEQRMLIAWKLITEKQLSVRVTEQLVKEIELGKFDEKSGKKKKTKKKDAKDNVSPETAALLENSESKLRHIFGTQVKIQPKTESTGTIELEFYSIDDFERLLDLLSKIT